ncbi:MULTISPECIES: PhzF family phenazine biosynthesis protein [unclassified Polaromonas]|uniref:PhzF family phenazine biosynthesis protein n=1 Tax=unclassified Polaromonas TaxID=2638319 RepID=UPI000F08775C|nr:MULTISPECIES: PhzF family phenazine biosynthesis protein [unclassified Polaromonas]AYQ28908.1 PhzF family phenazine biosynthesis protein [Polaromonas sp. SP1]QGJ19974.1 PhzF family phenazine biosynthesis isomerase [Polaromonas sp. Pch-P]
MTPSPLHGLSYYQVDVFTHEALAGNGLTVFLPDSPLPARVMQRLTIEMRQFESIFLTPDGPGARFEARIFTMEEELDFAGHPLLGAAGLLHHLQAPQQTDAEWTLMLGTRAVQLTTTRHEGKPGTYEASMNQGVASFQPALSRADSRPFLAALNLEESQLDVRFPLQVVSTGLPYLLVPAAGGLEHARIVHPDFEALLATVGAKFAYVLDVAAREGRTWDNAGLVEDIATGSAAGPVGAYLRQHRAAAMAETITLKQGRFVGRPSKITVAANAAGEMRVSGGVVVLARGEFL